MTYQIETYLYEQEIGRDFFIFIYSAFENNWYGIFNMSYVGWEIE